MDTNNKLKLLQKWEKEHVKIDEAYDLIRKAFGSTPTLLLLVLCFQCLILIPKFCLYVCNLYIQDESRFCVGSIYEIRYLIFLLDILYMLAYTVHS